MTNRKHRPPILDEDGSLVPCRVPGCPDSRERRNGYCDRHYWRNHKNGSPEGPARGRLIPSNVERFWSFVDRRGGIPDYSPSLGECWAWTGAKSDGYGTLRINQSVQNREPYRMTKGIDNRIRAKTVKAHRFSYSIHVGEIPERLHLDHLCRNRGCVNPDHLEPVTQQENMARSPIWSKYQTGPDSPTWGTKRPISWFHNKYHVRGHSVDTMPLCPDCNGGAVS